MYELEEYLKYKDKYINIMINKLIYDDIDYAFDSFEKTDISEISFLNVMNNWIFYKETFWFKIQEDDKTELYNLILLHGEFLQFAIEQHSWNFSDLLKSVFFVECYIKAICEYSKKFDEYFKCNILEKQTLKYFNSPENKKYFVLLCL